MGRLGAKYDSNFDGFKIIKRMWGNVVFSCERKLALWFVGIDPGDTMG